VGTDRDPSEKQNRLRYAVQPKDLGPGMRAGRCPSSKAHDRENLGLGGRRVLVSRQCSGKTLTEHKADRATVVTKPSSPPASSPLRPNASRPR
jgi:hypothetical protein